MLRAVLLVGLLAHPALSQTRADPEAAAGLAPKPLVEAQEHMIVAANPHASRAGAEVLAEGGSAADAAIAALLVLNVVEPQSSGIGGGAFALVHGPEGITSWDARETAPAAATADLFLQDGAPMPFRAAVASGRSVGVPGMVRLMEALHARHGELPWARLFAPTIALARDGFDVSPRLAALVGGAAARLADADAAAVFLPGGKPLEEGAPLRQPALAETLEAIAAGGADAFYAGAIAGAIVDATRRGAVPGALSAADLAGYRVIERPAVCHAYLTFRVCGMGPPSSGATTVGQILMLLDRLGADDNAVDGPDIWHLFAEASRLAYADRARYLADSDFVKVPLEGLLDPVYMDARAGLVDGAKAGEGRAEAGEPPWKEGRIHAPDLSPGTPGTTHLSVVDGNGLAISLTASIETAFGSGRMAAGFLLNNQLTDFSFRPAAEDGRPIANAVAPGKRPRSSMAPTIVLRDGVPAVLAGSPGGSRIPEYVAQALVGVLRFGLDPATAVTLPHVSQRNGDSLAVEPWLAPAVVEDLAERGHAIDVRPMTSGLHLIVRRADGVLLGGADPRREGVAVGR